MYIDAYVNVQILIYPLLYTYIYIYKNIYIYILFLYRTTLWLTNWLHAYVLQCVIRMDALDSLNSFEPFDSLGWSAQSFHASHRGGSIAHTLGVHSYSGITVGHDARNKYIENERKYLYIDTYANAQVFIYLFFSLIYYV